MSDDLQYMRRALDVAAAQCPYVTAPNPRIGCVIVKDGVVLGEGSTQAPGHNHAEIQALEDATAKGHDVRGATVYATLEPCSHFGRTPPCADALIRAGVARVVASIVDPDPRVAGKGYEKLRTAGIEVVDGVMAEEARAMNLGFLSRIERGRPWVRMKVAASLDGRTALLNGRSQWITSPEARDDGHVWRSRAASILTGIGTVMADDPQLTVRAIDVPRQPQRIVVDSKLSISPEAKVLQDGAWVFSAFPDAAKAEQLKQNDVEVFAMPNAQGRVDLAAMMRELAKREINEVHVEAGAVLNGALLEAGLVDELLLYVAPSLLGKGHGMFDLPAIERLEDKFSLRFHEIAQVGPDLRILARFA